MPLFKRAFLIVSVVLFAFSGLSCQRPEANETATFFALDTYCSVTVYGRSAPEGALMRAEKLVCAREELWSVTRPESLISGLNAGQDVLMDEETQTLLELAESITRLTGGAFDVTVYPLVEAWGYYSGEYRVPDEAALAALLDLVGGEELVTDLGQSALSKGQKIDLGAIAKGYIADLCADQLRAEGVESAILSFGGNVCALGTKPDGSPFNVALTDPADPAAYLGTVKLSDASLVTAGGYQRGFTENGVYYHHILDPKTGRPADSGLLSASVLSEDGARADALATACFVLGEEASLDLWRKEGDFELILVREDGSLVCTEGLADLFYPEEKTVEWVKKNV